MLGQSAYLMRLVLVSWVSHAREIEEWDLPIHCWVVVWEVETIPNAKARRQFSLYFAVDREGPGSDQRRRFIALFVWRGWQPIFNYLGSGSRVVVLSVWLDDRVDSRVVP